MGSSSSYDQFGSLESGTYTNDIESQTANNMALLSNNNIRNSNQNRKVVRLIVRMYMKLVTDCFMHH